MNVEKPDVVNAVATVLADTFVFSSLTHGAHWNVQGSDFRQYHDFFGEIYDEAFDAVDPLAEQIRKLGAFPPFRLYEFARLSNVQDEMDCGYSPRELTMAVYAANEIVIRDVEMAFAVADAANEQGIADLLAGREDIHKKWRWQLSASLKGN